MSKNRVFVVGVGMTKLEKPGASGKDYPDFAKEAIEKALADAAIPFNAVEQACVGYVYGDSTCGQRALYTVGLTGIPVYNVNNNCSTGSSALFMARQFIQGGLNDCVLCLGFEKMDRGSLSSKFTDRTNPLDQHIGVMSETHGMTNAPFAPQLFGNAGREHMQKYGTKPIHFAMIAEKNHRHSANNPYSQFRDVYTLDQIMKSAMVHEPLTKLQCCPTSDGAGAAILCSEKFVYKYGLQNKAVEIVGMSMATDLPSTFGENSMLKVVGYDMTKKAAQEVYKQAGLGPEAVQVVELHDCFSANELITYEALGLCEEGKAAEFIESKNNTYGGKYVVNPSGGLISKGHPLGATGLLQCSELCWQIRGLAEKRQVPNCTVALQHNLGLGGAVVVAMYKKAQFDQNVSVPVPSVSRAESLGTPKNIETAKESAPAVTPAAKPAAAAAAAPAASSSSTGPTLKADAVFEELKKRVNEETVKKIKTIYRFEITPDNGGAGKSYYVDLKNGSGSLAVNGEGKADTTITIKDSDFVSLMTGKLNPMKAFQGGQLKVKGNIMKAQSLQQLVAKPSKL